MVTGGSSSGGVTTLSSEVADKIAPGAGKHEPYVIPMPPPNVTGKLHMGHAMFASLEDVMVRFHRMYGNRTLWLPGVDHAGIATQMLVERQLVSEGTSRKEVGREKFLERVWEWKEEKGSSIVGQLRRIGPQQTRGGGARGGARMIITLLVSV